MALDTFLFDLDGTLLPIDIDEFIQVYFRELCNALSDIVAPKKLYETIWAATEAMVKNTEYKTNEEVFMNHFFQLINGDKKIYQQRFNDFYDSGFLKIKEHVEIIPLVPKIIDILKIKGYQLVIATNPLFPLKAIHHRIRWAGLNIQDFSYISSYENSHYCKPHIKYYEEILQKINKQPEQCMMVGNDVREDLVVGELGISTFLIENFMIDHGVKDITCTKRGKYEDLYHFVENLKSV